MESAKQPRPSDRRKGLQRYIVPDPVYAWFLKWIFLGSSAIALAFGAIIWFYQGRLLERLRTTGLIAADAAPAFEAHARSLFVVSALVMVFFVLAVSLLASYLMHKVAGPMYRLRIHFEGLLASGEGAELAFRKHDRFQEVAELFNRLVAERLSLGAGRGEGDVPRQQSL